MISELGRRHDMEKDLSAHEGDSAPLRYRLYRTRRASLEAFILSAIGVAIVFFGVIAYFIAMDPTQRITASLGLG